MKRIKEEEIDYKVNKDSLKFKEMKDFLKRDRDFSKIIRTMKILSRGFLFFLLVGIALQAAAFLPIEGWASNKNIKLIISRIKLFMATLGLIFIIIGLVFMFLYGRFKLRKGFSPLYGLNWLEIYDKVMKVFLMI